MRRFAFNLTLLLTLLSAVCPLPVRILATSDMHGYLEAQPRGGQWVGGAAEMLAYWEREEGYTPERFLLLSGGDLATGPALSTLFQGEPVLRVMNLMGYDASALGNHEFDFGRAHLDTLKRQATFPLLAGNVLEGGTPAPVAAYTLTEEPGMKVAIIGLALGDLHRIAITEGVQATPYVAALRTLVPEVRAKGAQTVIVLAHVPFDELVALAGQVKELQIPLMLGGHDHKLASRKVEGTWVVNSGQWWESYARVDLDVTPRGTRVQSVKTVWLQQEQPARHPAVQAEIARWQARLSAETREVLGHSVSGLSRTPALYNLIADALLASDPGAQISLNNIGSLRCDLAPGPFTRGGLIELLPFNNRLLRLAVTGEQLLAYLPADGNISLAGLRREGGRYLLAAGTPLEPTAVYRVVLNSYMYATSDRLKAADPAPVTVAGDWRDALIAWFKAHPTEAAHPLERLADPKARVGL
jgi:5'-nucleotidase/UDP-sugar diphosphatase